MAYIDTLIEQLKTEKYNGEESEEFFYDVKRLHSGEPYEYVLGYTTFLGAHIDLSLRPMIPRLESAFWLERAIGELKNRERELGRALRLADVFSGSGALGIALGAHFPTAHVDISELDPRLKKQIEINIEKNNLATHRVHAITASALDGLEGKYDAIVAVPPYIPYEALPELDREQQDFEPHLAFFAHEDGHEFLKIMIDTAWELLDDGGTLYMEADMDDTETIRKFVEGTKWSKLEFWPDPYGSTPNVVLRK